MIDWVYATDGKLGLNTNTGFTFESDDPMELANFMLDHGLPLSISASSSVHFCSEFGFEKDGDADKLLDAAVARYELFDEGIV